MERFIRVLDVLLRLIVMGGLIVILVKSEPTLTSVVAVMGMLLHLALDRCADAVRDLRDRVGVKVNVSGDVRLSDD
ncbi:hypothetical protein [Roseomonas xinghualingensis]|uniref:hypothetical protein n=1 Tax=Roseomonas xinghualingensis TaxID=2986475 RepID=UPI0021F1E4E6|nr:hypothetical protein [Roseomonas sp. SXEYE001]MCV4209878.1 hypothetical protein [Roseomonas sp. SXEYE001]MCV4209973.1 hypothetical protein [Roseomonas sp. SXEYE001]